MAIYTKVIVVFPLAILCLSGCSSMNEFKAYDGERRPDDQVAHIENWSRYRGLPFVYDTKIMATIITIDGQLVTRDPNAVARVEMLPGRHCFKFEIYSGEGIGIIALATYGSVGTISETEKLSPELCLDAEAGHSYQVRAAINAEQQATFWIIDQDDDRIVSGVPPLELTAE